MSWIMLDFDDCHGITLPQVMFMNPDWFFSAFADNKFLNNVELLVEAKEIDIKARNIKVPQKPSGQPLVAEYSIDRFTRRFVGLKLIPASKPINNFGLTIISNKIDLSFPWQKHRGDLSGYNIMIDFLKTYLLNDKNILLTRAICEKFFEDRNNFEL